MGWFDWLHPEQARQIPDVLWQKTLNGLPFLANLAVDEKKRLKTLAEQFLAEKEFSTAGGLQLTDEICVSIAAQGCLPILESGLAAYGDWVGIIVYPNEFIVARQLADADGVVHEFTDVLAGEAWQGGPLVISWHDVEITEGAYNVVIHEFAHKLDMQNGEVDGLPVLHSDITVDQWKSTFLAAYDNFCQRVDQGEDTRIDPYASETPGEFFAVFSESFFGLPDVVANEYPALYALLCRYYRQDPLARLTH